MPDTNTSQACRYTRACRSTSRSPPGAEPARRSLASRPAGGSIRSVTSSDIEPPAVRAGTGPDADRGEGGEVRDVDREAGPVELPEAQAAAQRNPMPQRRRVGHRAQP